MKNESERYKNSDNYADNIKFNCIHLCLADIAKNMECNYEHIFLNSWDFDLEKPISIGKKYDTSYQMHNEQMMRLLTLYAPIDYIKLEKWDILNNSFRLTNEEILLVEMDSYDCKWSDEYQEKHLTYYYLVKIDNNSNSLTGHCPYYNIYDIRINNNILEKSLNAYIFFKINKNYVLTSELLKYHLFSNMRLIIPDTIFNRMEQFASLLDNITSFDVLNISNKIEENLFVQRLAHVEISRYGIKLMLEMLFHDNTLNHNMGNICILWTNIKNYIIKGLLTQRKSIINRVIKDILEVAHLEKNLYDTLFQIKNDNVITRS